MQAAVFYRSSDALRTSDKALRAEFYPELDRLYAALAAAEADSAQHGFSLTLIRHSRESGCEEIAA